MILSEVNQGSSSSAGVAETRLLLVRLRVNMVGRETRDAPHRAPAPPTCRRRHVARPGSGAGTRWHRRGVRRPAPHLVAHRDPREARARPRARRGCRRTRARPPAEQRRNAPQQPPPPDRGGPRLALRCGASAPRARPCLGRDRAGPPRRDRLHQRRVAHGAGRRPRILGAGQGPAVDARQVELVAAREDPQLDPGGVLVEADAALLGRPAAMVGDEVDEPLLLRRGRGQGRRIAGRAQGCSKQRAAGAVPRRRWAGAVAKGLTSSTPSEDRPRTLRCSRRCEMDSALSSSRVRHVSTGMLRTALITSAMRCARCARVWPLAARCVSASVGSGTLHRTRDEGWH